MTKQQMRAELKLARAQIPQVDRVRWDQDIAKNLQNWDVYNKAKKIMIYLSFGWEINTWPIVDELTARGVEIYVPVVQSEPRALVPTRYTSREDLTPAVFGILEPSSKAPTLEPIDLDLVVVPALAFSLHGFRIGYGGGYYDRFLATTPAVSVGLCYSCFLQELPRDPWDQAVDFLVSEERVLGRK